MDLDVRQQEVATSSGSSRSTSVKVIDETDAYTSSVAGVTVDVVRAGEGAGPNLVLGISDERHAVTTVDVGFPMFSHATIADDAIVATAIRTSDGSSEWCGVPLEQGDVIVYGPGVEHLAHNHPGLGFTFVTTGIGQLLEVADGLGTGVAVPGLGEVTQYRGIPQNEMLLFAMDAHIDTVLNDRDSSQASDRLLRSFVGLLAQPPQERPLAGGKAIDSRSIVHACIEYAEETDRIPSISELCGEACVSERRLREAFIQEFDAPPSRFFRAWALDLAHRRLRIARPETQSVTDVAVGLGFNHLGRFASQYGRVYGETPSVTLRT